MKKLLVPLFALPLLLAATGERFPVVDGKYRHYRVIALASVKQVVPGMTRRQVYFAVGSPHFYEGPFAHVWNYAFRISVPAKAQMTDCKMQLTYDKGHLTSIVWDRPECSALAA